MCSSALSIWVRVDNLAQLWHAGGMPKRSSNKRPRDLNSLASQIVQEATGSSAKRDESGKNPAAVALGRLGGQKGGKARAAKLSPTERSEIAKKAAAARWADKDIAQAAHSRVSDDDVSS